jgi:hypothetical protein
MEQTTPNTTQPNLRCPLCKQTLETDDFFCIHCGYPRKGSEHEQRIFILKRRTKQSNLDEANKKLRQASNTLLIIGGIMTVFAVGVYLWGFRGAYIGDVGGALSRLIPGLIFIALGIWCLKRPLPAIICGFSLFLLFQIVNAVVAPVTILQFLIAKVAIILFLANGIRAAFDGEKLKRELNG